jgi:hypothetical protein
MRDSIAVRIAKRSPPLTKVDCDAIREIADVLAEADAGYAAGDTVSGEDLRDPYDLECLGRAPLTVPNPSP